MPLCVGKSIRVRFIRAERLKRAGTGASERTKGRQHRRRASRPAVSGKRMQLTTDVPGSLGTFSIGGLTGGFVRFFPMMQFHYKCTAPMRRLGSGTTRGHSGHLSAYSAEAGTVTTYTRS